MAENGEERLTAHRLPVRMERGVGHLGDLGLEWFMVRAIWHGAKPYVSGGLEAAARVGEAEDEHFVRRTVQTLRRQQLQKSLLCFDFSRSSDRWENLRLGLAHALDGLVGPGEAGAEALVRTQRPPQTVVMATGRGICWKDQEM